MITEADIKKIETLIIKRHDTFNIEEAVRDEIIARGPLWSEDRITSHDVKRTAEKLLKR